MTGFAALVALVFVMGLTGRSAGRASYFVIAVAAGIASVWLYLH